MEKYIASAAAADKKGEISFTVKLEQTHAIIETFRKLCPKIANTVSVDWDDEDFYMLRFTWKPGTFGSHLKSNNTV
jgi:hypothetical protein